jgi:hypothetical protein
LASQLVERSDAQVTFTVVASDPLPRLPQANAKRRTEVRRLGGAAQSQQRPQNSGAMPGVFGLSRCGFRLSLDEADSIVIFSAGESRKNHQGFGIGDSLDLMKLFVNESPNAPIDRNIELHQKIELSSNRVDLRCLLYVVHDSFRNRERLSQGTFYPYKQRLRLKFTHTAHRNTVLVNCNSEIGAIRDRKDALLKKTGVLVGKTL